MNMAAPRETNENTQSRLRIPRPGSIAKRERNVFHRAPAEKADQGLVLRDVTVPHLDTVMGEVTTRRNGVGWRLASTVWLLAVRGFIRGEELCDF